MENLVVNTEGTGKIVWWPTMQSVNEWENRISSILEFVAAKKMDAYHSAYFDEVGKAHSCEKLKIERLGYDCASLKDQTK